MDTTQNTAGENTPKKAHNEMASHSVEHSKERTAPLSGGSKKQGDDEEEGRMNNGELGSSLTENKEQ